MDGKGAWLGAVACCRKAPTGATSWRASVREFSRVSYFMGERRLICSPQNVWREQRIRVVVAFIDARPARMHEDFRQLALEALMGAWPCKQEEWTTLVRD
jgi:hypothetical protein